MEGHKKAMIYKCLLVYSRAEGIERYGGSNQVSLRGNSDNVYYKPTPEDCQSERVDNLFITSCISANEMIGVATNLETVG